MKTKQASIFGIVGSTIWIALLAFSTVALTTTLVSLNKSTMTGQTLIPVIIQNISLITTAISFLLFFVNQYSGSLNKGISLFAVIGSGIWVLSNIWVISSKTKEYLMFMSSPAISIISLTLIYLSLITSIAFLIFFLINYTNLDKEEKAQTNRYITSICALIGAGLMLITQILLLVNNYLIYSMYGIPILSLISNIIALTSPICFLICFMMQFQAIIKKR